MAEGGIGVPVKRAEDLRFLTGRGRYTSDLNLPGQVYGYFLRSVRAHARIDALDISAAMAAPGVVAVFTGDDIKTDGIGSIPCAFAPDKGPMNEPPRPALAQDKVRFVGDLVAMVVAETIDAAKDAAGLITVDYDDLGAVVSPADALAEGAPELHADAPGNVCFQWQLGDKAATDDAFAKADHIVGIDIVNNRKIPNAIEPRAACAAYDPASGAYTLYLASQNPHVARLLLAAFVLKIPEHKLRVVSYDVGGGFGSKIPLYPEEAVITWAAGKIGRPIKWTAERAESFLADTHGRDHETHAELALDDDGNFLGLRVDTKANMGAYLSTFGPMIPTYLYAPLLAGQYKTPAVHCAVTAVFTTTAPVDAERGAGRPEATYVVERLVTKAARQLGLDQAEIRRRNLIAADAFPYQSPVVMTYDSGNYPPLLDEALKRAKVGEFEQRRAAAAAGGKLRGIGFSSYIEACGLAPSAVAGAIGARAGLFEAAEIRFNPTGSVTLFTGTQSQGQGHETCFAQIIAERLGIPLADIDVVQGDTDRGPFGMGTYGSRSLAVGGSAIAKAADKIVAKGKQIAAHLLEAEAQDISFEAGAFKAAGTNRSVTMAEVAFAAYVPHNYPLDKLEPGLDETAFYDPPNFTFPAGCHISEVEIDPETGAVEIVNWVAVDDFGVLINPMIVEGQVHGGIAHGIGQAMLEHCVYDSDSGQLVTGSYMDYAMPRADDLPSFEVATLVTPCPHNPLGVKGCGETGAIAAPAALINAVTDAIGIEDLDMPATREKIWRACRAAHKG
ncbi:MAG: xanthine dehydrogenase family protein molybdopterin-binding subunit [Alphaproteobacteria bacterium]